MPYLLRKKESSTQWEEIFVPPNTDSVDDQPLPGSYVYARVPGRFHRSQIVSPPNEVPVQIQNLRFWLSARHVARFKTENGEAAAWEDVSGAQLVASQQRNGQPVIFTGGTLPGFQFPGSSSRTFMELPKAAFDMGDEPYTFVSLIIVPELQSQSNVFFFSGPNSPLAGRANQFWISDDGQVFDSWFGSGDGFNVGTLNGRVRPGDRLLCVFTYAPGSYKRLYVGGTKEGDFANPSARSAPDDYRVCVGGRDAPGNIFNGTIEEEIYYDRALSEQEISDLFGWAQDKLQLQVPAYNAVSDIPNLRLHLKAEDLALNDGDPVAAWADASGQGNDATQDTEANQPTYRANGSDGFPVVDFDGTDDWMRLPDGTVGVQNTAHTFFGVCRKRSNQNGYLLYAGNQSTNDACGLYLTRTVDFWDGSSLSSGPALTLGELHMQGWHVKPSGGAQESNSLLVQEDYTLQNTTYADLTTTPDDNLLGARPDDSGGRARFLDAEVAEIIYFDRALTGDEFKFVQDYLNDKYGL